MNNFILSFRKIIGLLTQIGNITYSKCRCCGITWKYVDGHNTPYKNGIGCFPLCKWCWKHLTPKERLPYYRELYNYWVKDVRGMEECEWKDIESAVLQGK